MAIKKILVFVSSEKTNDEIVDEQKLGLTIKKWTPGLFRYLPPNSPLKYIIFWFAHYLKIFNSNSYCAFYLENKNKVVVSSLIFAPKLFIWPFMNKNDVQIKNVITIPEYRGKSLSYCLTLHSIKQIVSENRKVWSLVHADNKASIALHNKVGLTNIGIYKIQKKILIFINLGTIERLKLT